MSLVCKLYDSAGTTLIKTIDCHRIEIDADRNRSVRRTATFRCPKTYLQDLKTLGRLVRIYDSGQGDGYQGWESVVAAEMNNDDLDSWTVSGGSGTVTYVDDTGCSYWKKARFTGYKWFTYPTDITFDPTALYRLTTRVAQVSDPASGGKGIYCGVNCYTAGGINLRMFRDLGSQHYIAASGQTQTADGSWTTYTGYLRGTGTPAGPRHVNIYDPAFAYPGTYYIRPLVAVNHACGDGVADVDYVRLDKEAKTGQVFEGYIDEIELSGPPGLEECIVYCRDRSKGLVLARWQDETTYEDTSASEGNQLASTATGSSSMTAGDDITSQARIGSTTLEATVGGIQSEVEPDSETGDILDGDYSVDYSASGLTLLTLTTIIDLQATEDLQSTTVTTNGTDTIYLSTDGTTYTEGTTGNARYIKVVITKSSGPITASIAIVTDITYSASDALVDDETPWRPDPDELTPYLELDCGSSVNMSQVSCRLGLADGDPLARYEVEVSYYHPTYSTWFHVGRFTCGTRLEALLAAIGYDVSMRYVRITFLGWHGPPPAVRFVEIKRPTAGTATGRLFDLLQTIANDAGETRMAIQPTLQLVPAVTWNRGTTKWESLYQLCRDLGWELFYDRFGFLTARFADTEPWVDDMPEFDSAFEAQQIYSDADIYNIILADNGSPTNPLQVTKTNDSAWSKTSTVNLGERASPILFAALANTQNKLDLFALEQLRRASRQTARARLTHIADGPSPASDLEPGDCILVRLDPDDTAGTVYVIEKFTLVDDGTSSQYDVIAEVQEL